MSAIYLSSLNYEDACLADVGCVPAGLVFYGESDLCSNGWRIVGIDPLPRPIPWDFSITSRYDDGALWSQGTDTYAERDCDDGDVYFVAYHPRNNPASNAASWRFFL